MRLFTFSFRDAVHGSAPANAQPSCRGGRRDPALAIGARKRCPPRLDALLMVVGFVVVFVVGDRVLDCVRLPHILDSSNGVRWKWELYERADPQPHVVFIGSSLGLFGISPAAVDGEVRALCGKEPHSLNLCTSAASVYTQYMLARRIVESGQLPDIVYLEVSPVSTVAVPHSWLESGLRALGDSRDLPVAASVDDVLLRETLGSTFFASYRQWKDCRLIARTVLRGAAVHPTSRLRRDGRGWAEWTSSNQAYARNSPKLTPDQPYGGELATFAGCNPNPKALRNVVRLLREAGVSVRLMELPHRSTALPASHPHKNDVYRAFIDRAVGELGVSVLRAPRNLVTDDDFFDYCHLNARGAARLSRWLAGDVAATLVARGASDLRSSEAHASVGSQTGMRP